MVLMIGMIQSKFVNQVFMIVMIQSKFVNKVLMIIMIQTKQSCENGIDDRYDTK